MSTWPEIITVIQNHARFVLTTHINPDGDALGSELALAEHLTRLGKKVAIINSDMTPDALRFLDPHKEIKRYVLGKHAGIIKKAEVIIVLDASGGWERLGRVGQALAQTQALKICLDHHPEATTFVDIAYLDTAAAATGELVYALVRAMAGVITPSMARSLYTAIMTDTGSFRFPKTGPQTHHITATLLAAGVNPLDIYRQVYEQYPLKLVRLKGHVLDVIQTTANGQLAYYGLNQATLKAYGVEPGDLDGFASLGQQIGGVRVVVFAVERARNRVKISLRSDGSVAINQIAAAYSGGGHPSAAGATVEGKLEEVLAEAVEKIKKIL
jgi:bifunctional oligoribonuclease and PAP phosphatase NrnA